MKNLIIALTLLIGVNATSSAQEKVRKEQKGDRQIFVFAYDKAIKSYTKAEPLTLGGKRKLAESYRKTNQNILAADTYAEIVSGTEGVIPEDYYNYAMILKSTGNYKEAGIWMDKFQAAAPNDLRSKSYAANKANLKTLSTHNDDNKVERLSINTDAQDFGAGYYQNGVVFSSSRERTKMIKRTYNGNGLPFLDLYVSEKDGDQLKDPEVFNKRMNGNMHDGPACFSNDDTFMAFTRNNNKDKSKDKIVELQLFFSTFTDGKWSKETPFIYNNPGYSVGHPNLTADGKTLYFASDMPSGFGGSDLYKSTKDANGAWTKPENLGNKINTEGDELFPFLEEKNNVLIFTSTGHFGLGGMDIFMSPINGSEYGTVSNPGAPINTMHDDYAVIMDGETNQGFFSSDRNGGNDDIYSLNFTKGLNIGKKLEGIAMDEDGRILPQTFVTLLDNSGNTLDTLTTKEDGSFLFLVDSDQYLKLTGTKENYVEGTNTTNTFGDEYLVKADLVLPVKKAEVPEEVVVVEEKPTIEVNNGKLIILNPIYFDFNKYDIRADAAIELDRIVKIMNENPKMVVVIRAYTDSRANEGYNQTLSDKRAEATLAYIKKRITNPDRISGDGYGETVLVNSCSGEGDVVSDCSEEDHQKNRRTEFIIVSQ